MVIVGFLLLFIGKIASYVQKEKEAIDMKNTEADSMGSGKTERNCLFPGLSAITNLSLTSTISQPL